MEFHYHEIDRDILVLGADGGLNDYTAHEFVKQLESLVDAGLTRIIVDCTHLESIASIGIAVLVRLHKKLAARDGDVKLAAAKTIIFQALEVMHMSAMFEIYPDVEQARLAFRPKTGNTSRELADSVSVSSLRPVPNPHTLLP